MSRAAAALIKHRQGHRQSQEDRREDGRRPAEQVRRAAPGHERPHALRAANAKPAALTALDQHDADERQGDEQMDDQQNGAQREELSKRHRADR